MTMPKEPPDLLPAGLMQWLIDNGATDEQLDNLDATILKSRIEHEQREAAKAAARAGRESLNHAIELIRLTRESDETGDTT